MVLVGNANSYEQIISAWFTSTAKKYKVVDQSNVMKVDDNGENSNKDVVKQH